MRTRVIKEDRASQHVSISASRLADSRFRRYRTCSIHPVSTMDSTGLEQAPRTEEGPFVEEAVLEVVAVLGRVIPPAVYRLPDCALASPQLVAELAGGPANPF